MAMAQTAATPKAEEMAVRHFEAIRLIYAVHLCEGCTRLPTLALERLVLATARACIDS